MSNICICEICHREDSEVACLCQFPPPTICISCYSLHSMKGKDHITISLSDCWKVQSDEDLHMIRLKLLSIDYAEHLLLYNTKAIDNCEQEIYDNFSSLIADIKEIEQKHLFILEQIRCAVNFIINEAVSCARKHAIDKEWDDSFGNELAKKTWGCSDRKGLLLFEYNVFRPCVNLDKLMSVQMISQTILPKRTEKPRLSFISDNSLYHFNVAKDTWEFVLLDEDILRTWDISWSSALALFDDSIHLLCTGGGSPLTNSVYEVNTMDGSVLELSPMGSTRAGHGLTQFKGKFYAFGGHGAPDTAEMFIANEDRGVWEPLGNMQASHSWFTSYMHNDLIYLCGGHTPVVEVFNPATHEFEILCGFELSGTLAESCVSTGVCGDEIVCLSSTTIKRHNLLNGGDLELSFKRPMRSVWACMTPVVGKYAKVYLPSQERKSVWAVDVLRHALIEFKAGPIVQL